MINITDTEYRDKELMQLLADTERKMGVNACFTVKDAYNKGLERGKHEMENYIERCIIDELQMSQANLQTLRAYLSDDTNVPGKNIVDYAMYEIIDRLESVTTRLGYKSLSELE